MLKLIKVILKIVFKANRKNKLNLVLFQQLNFFIIVFILLTGFSQKLVTGLFLYKTTENDN